MRNVFNCIKCGYKWLSNLERPKACPECKSLKWDHVLGDRKPVSGNGEAWLPIKDTDDEYYISMNGVVWSTKRGRIIKRNRNQITIQRPYGTITLNVPKTVLRTFMPNSSSDTDVIVFRDGDVTNFSFENLEWR